MALRLFSEGHCRAVHPTGQGRAEGRWRGRWLIAGCLSSVLVLSVALACASPPDPSWIPGFYDDRDYDDVVGMVTDATGVMDSQVTHGMNRIPAGPVPGAATGSVPTLTVHRDTIRGPPIETRDASGDLLLRSQPTMSPALSLPQDRSTGPELRFAFVDV